MRAESSSEVEGDENNPATQGRLCVRCITLKDYIYNPSRILHPMKRDPQKRGVADAWEEITWDEEPVALSSRSATTRSRSSIGRESICRLRRYRSRGRYDGSVW